MSLTGRRLRPKLRRPRQCEALQATWAPAMDSAPAASFLMRPELANSRRARRGGRHDRLGGGARGAPPLPGGQLSASRSGSSAGGTGKEGGNHVGRVTVEGHAGAVVAHRGPRIGVAGCSWTSRSGTPASRAAVMNAWRSVCGPTGLLIPALRASRRTIRQAACRSRRSPLRPRKIGPSTRSPMAKSMARAVRGADDFHFCCLVDEGRPRDRAA